MHGTINGPSRTSGMTRAGLGIVVINLLADLTVAAIKFAAAYISGSTAMSSEGVHSLVDAGTEAILLYGLIASGKGARPKHQLGHGREIYFCNFVVAVLIFALGAGVALLDGLHQVARPKPIDHEGISCIVLACSALLEGTALWAPVRRASVGRGKDSLLTFLKRRRDLTASTILFGGVASLVGILATAGGLLASRITGVPRFDGVASLVIAATLAITAIRLAAQSKSLLIGVPADPSVVAEIIEDTRKNPTVKHVNGMISAHLAPEQLLVALSVWFEDELSKAGIEQAIANVEDDLRRRHPQTVALFVKPQSPERFCTVNGHGM
jgi:cation diffusion facilitator family transporter